MKTHIKLLVSAVLLTQTFAVSAESARREAGSGGGDARKAQLMMRQLAQAKTQLEADNAKLAAEIKSLKDQVKDLESDLGKQSKSLNKAKTRNDKLLARVSDDKNRMQLMMEKYRNTIQVLRMEKANNQHLKFAVEERNDWIGKCKANNDTLYEVNMELVDRYRNKSVWQELAQAEPFTGLGDVKMEVIAEEYRYKLDDLQVADFKSNKEQSSATVQ